MIICRHGNYAYTGATISEAYKKYINSGADHDKLEPTELEWYTATAMKLELSLTENKSSVKRPANIRPPRPATPSNHRPRG